MEEVFSKIKHMYRKNMSINNIHERVTQSISYITNFDLKKFYDHSFTGLLKI